MTKQTCVPKLRFPEFSENWEVKKLGEVYIEVIDGDRGSNYPNGDDFSKVGYCLFLNAKNVTKNGFSFTETMFISKEKDNKLRKGKLKRDDIVLTTRGSIGHIAFYNSGISFENLRINSGMVIIRGDKNYLNLDYLYKYLNSNQIQNEILKIAFGSAQPQLTVSEIVKLKIQYPPLPEQAKIANFLTAIDEKIQGLKEKKSLLEEYKKGLMQQIFSQKLRFKQDDGSGFPDWEEKTLGEVYNFYSTNSFSRENLNYEVGGIRNIHYGDIHTKFKTLFNLANESVPFINLDIDLSKIKESNYCQSGDLIIADASEDYADIGKTIEVVNVGNENVLAGLHTIHARPDLSKMKIGFGGHLMKSSIVRRQIMTIAQGTKVLSISATRLGNIKIILPNKTEQDKIANFLSSIDEKIEKVSQQIAEVESYKKGLLQQMFV